MIESGWCGGDDGGYEEGGRRRRRWWLVVAMRIAISREKRQRKRFLFVSRILCFYFSEYNIYIFII
jgi:hypothetical protein